MATVINAHEAHKRTQKSRVEAMNLKLQVLMQAIHEAISVGKFYIDLHDCPEFNDENIKYLKELGYTITVNVNNTCYDRISWE